MKNAELFQKRKNLKMDTAKKIYYDYFRLKNLF